MKLDIDFLNRLDAELSVVSARGLSPIDACLDTILTAGFDSCHYFHHCDQIFINTQSLVLCKSKGKLENFQMKPGDEIPYTASRFAVLNGAIGSEKRIDTVFCGKDQIAPSEELRSFEEKIGYSDKNRVMFPVYLNDRLVGKFTCVTNAELESQSSQVIQTFRITQSILEKYLSIYKDKLIKTSIDKGLEAVKQHSSSSSPSSSFDLKTLLDIFNEILCKAVNAKISSAFYYDWYQKKITKISEYFRQEAGWFDESYSSDTSLTALAYRNPKYKYISNLAHVIDIKNDIIFKDSLTRHNELLGCIHSIMYSFIGSKENKTLFRFFNKNSIEKVPFSPVDSISLETICSEFSIISDDVFHRRRLVNLQDVSSECITKFETPELLAAFVKKSLEEERIDDLVYFGKSIGEENFTIYFNTIMAIDNEDAHAVGKSSLLKRAMEGPDVVFIGIEDGDKTDVFSSLLRAEKITGLVIFRVLMNPVTGAIAVPIRGPRLGTKEVADLPKGHVDLMKSYSTLLTGALSLSNEKFTASGALEMMAHIGHEIKSPVIEMSNVALDLSHQIETLVNRITYLKKRVGDEFSKEIKDKRILIEDYRRGISGLVKVAQGVTLSVDKDIEVNFRAFRLFDLVENCTSQIVSELDELQGARNLRVNFIYNQALRDLPPIVGDWFLMYKIFENVLRNALKYSSPPGRRQPIEISVHANPQVNQVGIIVTNWGRPIYSIETEKIFRPFYRGRHKDPYHASRGLGMGLYLARTFAKLHNGTVRLIESKPTLELAHPEKRDTHGWMTKFEIIISRTLPPTSQNLRLRL